MPDASRAVSAVADLATTTNAQECWKATEDDDEQRAIANVNASTPCALTFVSSAVSAIPVEQLPARVSGFRYEAKLHCAAQNRDQSAFVDRLVGSDGPIVYVLSSGSSPAPPDVAAEVARLQNISTRAQARISAGS